MENFSNSESNLLHPELSREEAILRLNALTEAMKEAGTSWADLRTWADSQFSYLPEELKLWKIPEDECKALLDELSQQDREKFFECLSLYSTSARTDASSCTIMHDFYRLAGIQDEGICLKLYHKLTGASYECLGFEDWTQVTRSKAFYSCLRRARAMYAANWLHSWLFRQPRNKETTQGDI